MITHLRISGFALIDELELELGPGLTVITGETGAGKSIIVEALGLLRGGRSSVELIRSGRDEARVEAALDLPPGPATAGLRERLMAEGRMEDGELVVRRTINRAGRGRVHVGRGLGTASDLAATLGSLVDIASQHDQQNLTNPENQLAILDAFAEATGLRAEMAAAHQTLEAARSELSRFDADSRTRAEREDLLRYQLAELDAASLVDEREDEALKVERDRLRHAEKLGAAAAHGDELLYSGDDAMVGKIAGVARELGALAPLDPLLGELSARLREAQVVVEDVGRELARYASGTRPEPARLAEVEERLFLLSRLARKHGGTLRDAIRRQTEMRRELSEIGSFEDALAARREAVTVAEARAREVAGRLSALRREAAERLQQKVGERLAELGLNAAQLPVVVEPRAAAAQEATVTSTDLGPTGSDRVRFLFAPNPGEPPRPLARIASGGELSRVMLAMKQTLARTDEVLTYVFDEVDAGVGGATAETIGQKLKGISTLRQVIAVTHLPQIAVFADTHLRVTKSVSGDRTAVTVDRLNEKARTAEIARMLSGADPSRQAAAHASELLRRARAAATATAAARAR